MQTGKNSQRNVERNCEETKPQSSSLISRESLIARLNRGRKARSRFVESHLEKGIALQLRALRDRKNWNQQELAEKVGMTQNAISRLESSNYGKPTITTLKRLAFAYDVALIVRFIPFSQLVDWVSGTPRLDLGMSSSSLDVAAFSRDPGLHQDQNHGNPTIPKKSPNHAAYATGSGRISMTKGESKPLLRLVPGGLQAKRI